MGKFIDFGQCKITRMRERLGASRWNMFRKSEDGATIIEFAICAPVFFLMVFSLMEIGLNYTSDRMFSIGLDSAARKVKTGEFRANENFGAEEFRQEICNHPIMFLFDCSKVLVDVRVVAEFDEAEFEENEEGEIVTDAFDFTPGGRQTINVVRAFYPLPTLFPWSTFNNHGRWKLDAYKNNTKVMTMSVAFLTEPFS